METQSGRYSASQLKENEFYGQKALHVPEAGKTPFSDLYRGRVASRLHSSERGADPLGRFKSLSGWRVCGYYLKGQRMVNHRYIRWQGLAIAQLSVAVALISGLSVSALALGMSLLQNAEFVPPGTFRVVFAWSFPLLLLAAVSSCGAVVSRLLDFRLTARKIRKKQNPDYSRSLTLFWLGPEKYSRLTWFLFWLGCLAFLAGVVLLFTSIWAAYAFNF